MTAVSLLPTGGGTDHGDLLGLSDDDHAQYLLLAGRAGGQTAIGGTAASQELVLRGSSNANLGLIRAQSPIVFDDTNPANALSAYFVSATPSQTVTVGFVGGGMRINPVVTFTNSFFIWEGQQIAPNITSLVGPAFAAFTLLNALPVLRGTAAGFNPLAALTLNVGVTLENAGVFVGLTTANNFGMSFVPQTRVTGFLSTMAVTNQTAVSCRPTFSTIANSTANLGTIRGLHCQNPTVALFQPGSGTEILVAYIGLDVDAIGFGGNVVKAVVRSALNPASNSYFLLNNGGAQSNFGGGFIVNTGFVQVLSNALGLSLGNPGGSVQILWDGSQLVFNPIVGDNVEWQFVAGATTLTNPGFPGGGASFAIDYDEIGLYGATPVAQSAAYTRNAAVVEDRTLLASAAATTLNNNNVLAALIADLQAIGILG